MQGAAENHLMHCHVHTLAIIGDGQVTGIAAFPAIITSYKLGLGCFRAGLNRRGGTALAARQAKPQDK